MVAQMAAGSVAQMVVQSAALMVVELVGRLAVKLVAGLDSRLGRRFLSTMLPPDLVGYQVYHTS